MRECRKDGMPERKGIKFKGEIYEITVHKFNVKWQRFILYYKSDHVMI